MSPERGARLKPSRRETLSVYGRAAAVLPAAVVAAALTSPVATTAARLLILGGLAVSLWNPANALLIVALAAPIGRFVAGRFAPALRVSDTLALALLVGWLVHPAGRRGGPRVPAAAAMAVGVLVLVVLVQILPEGWREVVRVARGYLLAEDRTGMRAPALLEGSAIAFAATGLLRNRPGLATRLPEALCGGSIAAAVLAWTGGSPVSAAVYSAFLMMACAAGGLAARACVMGTGAGWRDRFGWAFASCAMLLAAFAVAPAQPVDGRSAFTHVHQEAGAAAAIVFVVVLAAWLWRVGRGIAARPRDARLIGCASGGLAFIVTGLARDTFNDADGALSFWLLLGLTLGLAGSNLLHVTNPPGDIAAPDGVQCR